MSVSTGPKVAEITAKPWRINLVASLLTVLFIGIAVLTVQSLPHTIPIGKLELVWFLVGVVLVFSLHELVHALTLVLVARLSWRTFKFGCHWKQLVLYCHCQQPVTIRAFQRCALAPLVTLGPLTVIAMLVYPAIWLAMVASVHLAGCLGDVWMLVQSRRFSGALLYMDFPDKIGGSIFEPVNESVCPPPIHLYSNEES